ncbi:MAG: RNA polymerase sigma factor [Bacteroidetes bacterium]|nr:RNA polymerase sigma factor [Bacteroidota bacterium]
MRHYKDEELIEGLRKRKSRCIDYLYQEYFPVLRNHLIHNSGNQQDVEDLFQEALIVLYNRVTVRPFVLNCSLKTYFISIGKNLWLQRLDYKYRLLYQADYEVHEPKEYYTIEDQNLEWETLEKQRLFYKNLMQLPTDCNRLLQLYCLKISFREIARLMNYKDEVYVKTRKYYCKNLLRKKIMNDPEYQQFIKYEGIHSYERLD